MKTHLLIPDTQIRRGVSTRHIDWLCSLIADRRPDVIVQIGDWYDNPASSTYKKSAEAEYLADIAEDIDAGNDAAVLVDNAIQHNYTPDCHWFKGNHEFRLDRLRSEHPKLSGLLDRIPFTWDENPIWKTYDYLKPKTIHGITYCHLFAKTTNGAVTKSSLGYGSASPKAMLQANTGSCTAGHTPGLRFHCMPVNGKKQHFGLIAGSFYLHDESYASPQGNDHWRGVILKHVYAPGMYDMETFSTKRLKKLYG